MTFLTDQLNQTATYWPKTGQDGFGNPTFATPVEILCRWEETTTLVRNQEGTEVVSESKVFLENDVVEGDYLFLGSSSTSDPRTVSDAFTVIRFRKIPGFGEDEFERIAYL